MQEFCHYNELFRDMCAPPAHLILENIAISPEGTENNPDYEPCICGFRTGFRDCIGCEWLSLPPPPPPSISPSLYLSLSPLLLSFSCSVSNILYFSLCSGPASWSEPCPRVALYLSFDPVNLHGWGRSDAGFSFMGIMTCIIQYTCKSLFLHVYCALEIEIYVITMKNTTFAFYRIPMSKPILTDFIPHTCCCCFVILHFLPLSLSPLLSTASSEDHRVWTEVLHS